MEKYCVYAHSSVPKGNIKIGMWYSLEELKGMFDMDYIKDFFTPSNFAWEEIESKEKVKVKNNFNDLNKE